jgi:hypothetical protein
MSQAIVTKFNGPTFKRLDGTITARSQGTSVTVPYRDAAGIAAAHCHACHELAVSLEWRGTWVGGALPDGSGYAFVLVDHAADVVEVAVPREPKPRGVLPGTKHMTKKEAVAEFREQVLPEVIAKYGRDDKPARAEAWNNFTDDLREAGQISTRQYETWGHP